jgi:fatty acid desaturase
MSECNRQSLESWSLRQDVYKAVEDLFNPRPDIFWLDFLISIVIGWSAFVFTCLTTLVSWQMFAAATVTVLALYRALAFIHEIVHLKSNALPGFIGAWNFLVGIPLLVPSFTYEGVHADHHRLTTYGTVQDPEYLPFAGNLMKILSFSFIGLFTPAFLWLRFLLLSPIGLLYPSFHRWLECHASSLAFNVAYKRGVSDSTKRSRMMLTELFIFGFWVSLIILVWQKILPFHIFIVWYGVMALISVIDNLRTLVSHRYLNQGSSMNLSSQVADSIDIPGNLWTELWSPVGLHYHALHHYFPTIPYHNLGIAYHRLIKVLPADSPYHLTTSSSFWKTLKTLCYSQN